VTFALRMFQGTLCRPPSAFRRAAGRPAFRLDPFTWSLHQPTMFWPISTMNIPGFGSVTETGFSVPVTRIGSIICERSAPPGAETTPAFSQPLSSYPGAAHPWSSMRASYSSPSYSLFVLIGPAFVSFQDSSLTTSLEVPSSNSIWSRRRSFGKPNDCVNVGSLQPRRKEPSVPQHHTDGVSSLPEKRR